MPELPAAVWNPLFPGGYPFVRHDFLRCLDDSGSATPDTGWTPCFVSIGAADSGGALAAAPVYLKTHSSGEFVFDHAWARAAAQLGQAYYPKQVLAIPFVPSTGPRLGGRPEHWPALIRRIEGQERELGAHSTHALFLLDDQDEVFESAGWLGRLDLQYHWQRRGAAHFDEFLERLPADRRKKIRRERRRVTEAGIRFTRLRGEQVPPAAWPAIHRLYAHTYACRGQDAYLQPGFWPALARSADRSLRVILGWQGDRLVCAALLLVGGDTLYGRHWGAAGDIHSLHFECCYYQGIELCLEEGLERFDAGTQGEHKLWRGFEPILTRSRHHLAPGPLRQAVARYLDEERAWVLARHSALQTRDPPDEST